MILPARVKRRLARGKVYVVSPGVGVRHVIEDGWPRAVAVVYGGHAKSLELEAVVAAAREALRDWPEAIDTVEVVVDKAREMLS